MTKSAKYLPIGLMLLVAIAGGLHFNNYGVDGSLIFVIALSPIIFAGLAVVSIGVKTTRYLCGLACVVLFDVTRWFSWASEVGQDFAIRDENTYGIATGTFIYHVSAYSIFFLISILIMKRVGTANAQ